MQTDPVEFVINCFERNIDLVTAPGFLSAAVAQHDYGFQLRTLLVNNVQDRGRAEVLAQGAVERGEVDRYFFVEDLLERALTSSGFREADFGRFLHWSDCCLVALILEGPDLLCYADVDLGFAEPYDWITPALDVMARDARVAVGNPTWAMPDGGSTVAIEADEAGPGYFLGYGFTDQIFLVRRSLLAGSLRRRPVPQWLDCPVSTRFPGAALGLFFEQLVDSFLRRHHLMRVTITGATFEAVPLSSYPVASLVERLRARRNSLIVAFLTRLRRRYPGLALSPRLRMTGLLDPAFSPAKLGA
ncbi:hypothetical protein GA0111570_101139 [Raineyella antarctica]|uniref:Uncharacterized protein n=1 Tax=Raineyella antarctica TaxID=1577474 RepID=A0A1G6GCZ9_9ACTN|nr:hypothetical protein [Raineyella antarctica]SDB79868.1 hypothetical protein GA0111570_101139 [Raineyella antarctica]